MKIKTNRWNLKSVVLFPPVVGRGIYPKTNTAPKAAELPRAVGTPIIMRSRQRKFRRSSFVEIATLSLALLAIFSSSSSGQDPACCGSWTQRSPLASPSARQHHTMAYDSVRHVVVLFGGEGPLGDTWEWDGNTWMQIAVTGPSARDESAMVFDSARGVVVLFGGGDHNNPQAMGETWEYPVGGAWVRRANSSGPGATTGPSPRVRHAMAYDSIRGKTVLFGGLDASGPGGALVAQADTWEWDGTAWTLRASTGPAARTSHAMAYDSARGQTVLFGGFGDVVYGDTWEWDGAAWTQKATTGPSARYDHAMAYAGGCPRTMLFAGYDSSGRVGNNWEWDGTVWTPLTTGPGARNGHKMAYDSFRRRFVLFGGYALPTGWNAETWEFTTARPFMFRRGRKDDFALPTDPTVRSARLNNALPGVTWAAFDDETPNRYVGHTFRNLPANIVRAELIIRMKPLDDAPNNDSLHLGLVSGPPATWAWQLNIRNLPGAGGTWNFGVNPTTTFTLNLGNLPTGVNILAKLASDRYLDLIVQDDTEIDWVDLRVWTCPRRPFFFGLAHSPLGQALLSPGANGELLVSNIGSSGQDGILVDLNNIEPANLGGFSWSLEMPEPLPIGAVMRTDGTGQFDGVPDLPAGSQGVEQVAAGLRILPPDFSSSGASTYDIALYRNDTLVYRQLAMTGSPGIMLNDSKPRRCSCKGLHWSWIIGKLSGAAAELQIAAGPTVVADRIDFTPNGATHNMELLQTATAQATGVPSFKVSTELVDTFGYSHLALGSAVLEGAGFLTLTNLGSSGQDGVEISFGKVDSFDVGLDPIVDAEGNPSHYIGAYLEAIAIGSLNGVPGQPLGVTRFTQVGPGIYDITADFTAIGSPTQHVQVFNQGTLVADFPGHTGPVGTASAWVNGIGKLGGGTDCIRARWPDNTSFLISGADGTSYIGDELRILAEGAQTINYKSALQLLTAGIPEITVVDAQSAFRPAPLGNISTRLQVGTADRVMIAGFIVQGSAPKHVLLRAIGPSLIQFGVPDALADPVLELHGPAGFTTVINNNWMDDPVQKAAILATGLAPTNNLEAAIDATLNPGTYTAIAKGNNNTTGVGLVEVYDLNATSGSLLANISTRGFVQTGDKVMIGGFIVVSQPTRVIVRAIGPSLTQFGVPDALANPTLQLRDSNGTLVIANNDWQDDPAQAAQLTAAGLAPTNPLESGLATTLSPGLYTALVAGVNNATGNAVVEAYALP